jgi:hypothetical protein
VTDRFYVVAIGVPYESAVIVRVVFGPHAWLVENLGSGFYSNIEEGAHCRSIGSAERDVRLTETFTGCLLPEPEVRHRRDAEPDRFAEVHDPSSSNGRENLVVERRTAFDVGTLDREMVKHESIVPAEAQGSEAPALSARHADPASTERLGFFAG